MANTGDSFSEVKNAAVAAAQSMRGSKSSGAEDPQFISLLRSYRSEHVQCRKNMWASDVGGASFTRDNRCSLCKEADERL